MIGNTEFILLILLSLGVLFLVSALKAKELAVSAAINCCRKSGVQFLDGTAVLKKLRLLKTSNGTFRFYRYFTFDYSEDGSNRKQGEVMMLGHQVERASLWLTLDT